MEYLDFIIHLPLHIFNAVVFVWGAIAGLPFMDTVIGWFISFFWDALRGFGIFLALWYPRNYAEKRWLKRRLGRKKAVRPPDHTDTAAIASVSSAFGNHH